jgi:putative oxidoreductase
MKIASLIARLLLGALMVFAGANHIFNFLPQGPMPSGVAGQLLQGMMGTGYMAFVGVCEVIAGLLLLINRFAPFALTVLAAIIVNIIVVDVQFFCRCFASALRSKNAGRSRVGV